MLDRYGNEIKDRIYNLKDYDRKMVIDQRTQLIAEKITEFLKATDRFAKTIVFCNENFYSIDEPVVIISKTVFWNFIID